MQAEAGEDSVAAAASALDVLQRHCGPNPETWEACLKAERALLHSAAAAVLNLAAQADEGGACANNQTAADGGEGQGSTAGVHNSRNRVALLVAFVLFVTATCWLVIGALAAAPLPLWRVGIHD